MRKLHSDVLCLPFGLWRESLRTRNALGVGSTLHPYAHREGPDTAARGSPAHERSAGVRGCAEREVGQGRWSMHPEIGMAHEGNRGVPRLPRAFPPHVWPA